MSEKSLIEYAQDVMNANEKEIAFKDLWMEVSKRASLTEEEAKNAISQFYTNLTIDGRFVALPNGFWDLRCRRTSSEIEMADSFYSDADESSSSEDLDENISEDEGDSVTDIDNSEDNEDLNADNSVEY